MLNVMMVLASNGSNVGGMEKQVALQANTLSQVQNIKVQVLAHPNYRALFESPCTFSPMPMHLGRRNPILVRQLVSKVRAHKPNLVHVHGNKAADLLYSARWFVGACKKVATIHGTKKPNRALAALDRRFAVSKGVERALLPLSSSVIGNAVPPYAGESIQKTALCERFGLDPKLPLLIAAGRLVPVKGYDSLMKACQHVDCNLVIFGEGSEREHLDRLQNQRIRLAGHESNVRQFFSAADALVINSEKEGFGLTLIEALQQGLPVLSTPIPLALELLPESCLLGATIEHNLAEELESKVNSLDSIKSDTKDAFEIAQRDFQIEPLTDKLIDSYNELTAQT